MRLVPRDGMTEIVGRIEDDAQLTGLLDTVAALGLSLVSVAPVTPTAESTPPVRAEASSDGRGKDPRTAPS